MAAIRLENLSKTYRVGWRKNRAVSALKNLSLEVREG